MCLEQTKVTEWIISGNPEQYNVVDAFHNLHRVDWAQKANMTVGDIVYIYISGNVKAIKFKCRVNKANLDEPDIDDREYDFSGQFDGTAGRYMELELIEEYAGDEYSREELIKHGFRSPQGPIRMPESVKQYLESIGGFEHKYPVNTAVWIATALLAAEAFDNNPACSKKDMYFKQTVIVQRAQELAERSVANARCSQWCCADNDSSSNNYLRGDLGEDNSLRRLSLLDEFPEKTHPEGLNMSDELIMNGNKMTMEELFYFVREQYSMIIGDDIEAILPYYEHVLGIEKPEYYPSLAEYDPGITTEEYERILSDEMIVKSAWLDTLYYLYLMGGIGSCKQIANRYGNGAAHYNTNAINVAKAVYKETNCPLCVRKTGKNQYWPILFYGRELENTNEGVFSYKVREPLMEAIKVLEKRGVFQEMKEANKEFDKNLILYGPPGTGKTYNSATYAVAICDGKSVEELTDHDAVMARYNVLKETGRIAFTTFHQSYGYEEFIEGIKPVVDDEATDISYTIEPGVFKKFCDVAGTPENIEVNHNSQVWLVRLNGVGKNDLKEECFREGTIRFSWEKENVDASYKKWFYEMSPGDYVVSYNSASVNIDGIGIIEESNPVYDEQKSSFKWIRKVKWLVTNIVENIYELNGGKYLSNFEIAKLSRVRISELMEVVSKHGGYAGEKNEKPYVFIIDEINRGNISKIFGELITLIESTKCAGMEEAASAILPYSGKPFSVPSNVYILGTMNTADRSIALMDTALRRRFQFIEMMPDSDVLRKIHADKVEDLDVAAVLDKINERITFLYDREHTIGHAFFTGLKDDATLAKLQSIFEKSVIPLLQEYFYEDYQKIQLVLGDNAKSDDNRKFILDEKVVAKNIFKGNVEEVIDLPEKRYSINKVAFGNINSYKEIL